MAGKAVETVKFEVFGEFRKADEALEGGGAHLGDVFEFHVIGDERFDLIGFVIGEAQTSAYVLDHGNADIHVAVEADAVAGFGSGAKGGRLADVVEERSPGECGRGLGGEILKHKEGVDPDVALGMILRRLGHVFHGGDFREDLREQVEFIEKFERAAGGALGEEACEFFADAFGGDDVDFASVPADGCQCGGFDSVAETSGKADGTKHSEFVFGETP